MQVLAIGVLVDYAKDLDRAVASHFSNDHTYLGSPYFKPNVDI